MPGNHESHIEGVISCPSCGSNYRLQHRQPNCHNCGAVLPPAVSQPGASARPRKFLGVGAVFKPFADSVSQLHRESGLSRSVGQPSLKEQVDGSVTCGWCTRSYPARPPSPNCESCGGVLPLPPSTDPGPAPPPPPRVLPTGFKFRIYVKQNLGGMIGIGGLVVAPLLLCLAFPLGVIIGLLGGVLALSNCLSAHRRRVALERGISVPGKIESVEEFGEAGTAKQLFRVYFRFEANGEPVQGLKFTYDPTIKQHFVGEPIWVVYLPQHPKYYAIWPPLA